MSLQNITFDNLKILKSEHVHMKNAAVVLQKINNIITDGLPKLQMIADFDLTLTKQREEGSLLLTSTSLFEKSKQIPQASRNELDEARKKYKPSVLDAKVPMDLRVEAMTAWRATQHKFLSGFEFDREELDELIRNYGHSLRDRTQELFSKLNNNNVPIMVFSAGYGDTIEAWLKQQDAMFDNVKIIANFFAFQENKLMGFKNHEEIIHVFNKNKVSVKSDYFKVVKDRKNIILFGDVVDDAAMAEGMENVENLLKIGFLCHNVEENLPRYKEAFDIVLVDDQTMNVVLDILSFIL